MTLRSIEEETQQTACQLETCLVLFYLMFFGRNLAFNNSADTSMDRLSLTSSGRGCFNCSWYFPSLTRSRMDKGLILFSPLVMMDVTLSRS